MLTLNFQTAETLHPWAKQILFAWVLLPEEKLEGGLEMQNRSGEGLSQEKSPFPAAISVENQGNMTKRYRTAKSNSDIGHAAMTQNIQRTYHYRFAEYLRHFANNSSLRIGTSPFAQSFTFDRSGR